MKTMMMWRRYGGVPMSALMLAASAAALAQQQQQQGATTQYGELAFGARQYYPQGCVHSGNTAVCTFVFVQQAQTQPIHIGWGGELQGIQLVDDSHVPHNPSAAYFVDNYGGRQMNMTVNRGDQGTMMVEFAQVDPQVASCSFTMGQQALTGIPVGQGNAGGLGAANSLAMGGGGTAAAAGGTGQGTAPALAAPNTLQAGNKAQTQRLASAQQANQATPGCNTPQMANTAACKLNAKMTNAQNQATNTAAAVAAPAATLKGIMNMFGAPAQQNQQQQNQQTQQH